MAIEIFSFLGDEEEKTPQIFSVLNGDTENPTRNEPEIEMFSFDALHTDEKAANLNDTSHPQH